METPTREELREMKREFYTKLDHLDQRLDRLDLFKESQEVRTAQVFELIAEIKDDTRWIRRTFTSALIGGTISAAIGFIVWFVKGGI